MGQEQSRSHELALKSAAGDIEGVRRLLAMYVQQQRNQSLLASLPASHRIDIDHQLPEGDFALELATTHQHVLIVRLLLEHGCNVDAQDKHGLTALMCSAHDRETAVALELLRLGRADVHLTDEAGMTALHFACLYGHAEHVRLLLSYGARGVGTKNKAGESALDVACHNARWEAARIILRHLLSVVGSSSASDSNAASAGINEDTLGPLVQPSLFPAAKAQEWELVKLLLEAGADPHAIDTAAGRLILDQFPSAMLSAYTLIQAQRRCDRIITLLYPFLVGSILETVIEFDTECWVSSPPISSAGAGASSSSSLFSSAVATAASSSGAQGSNARCLALPRTLVYLQRQNEAADRATEAARRLKLAQGLVSQALSSPSPSSSSSISRFSAMRHDSPFGASSHVPPRDDTGGVCSSPFSTNHPSTSFVASVSAIAPPSQGSRAGTAGRSGGGGVTFAYPSPAPDARGDSASSPQPAAAASAAPASASAAAASSSSAREPSMTSTSRAPLLLQLEMQPIPSVTGESAASTPAAVQQAKNSKHARQSSRSSLSATSLAQRGREDEDEEDEEAELDHVRIRQDSTLAAGSNA